jgi:hypothetical protein
VADVCATYRRGKCRGIEVAVKRLYRTDLDEKTLTDFKKEIEIMSKLNHPNVVLFMGTPSSLSLWCVCVCCST